MTTQVLESEPQQRIVEATLNFCGRMDFKPLSVARTSHGHPKRRGGAPLQPKAPVDGEVVDPNAGALNPLKIEQHAVPIIDASRSKIDLDLDRNGFMLLHHPSKVTDFKDLDQIEDVYYPEIRTLLKTMLGADEVEFPPEAGAYRNTRSTGSDEARAALIVHIDFTENGARHTLEHERPNRPGKIKRWGFYKIWRALSPVSPVDVPFALMDAQTLKPEDVIPVDTKYEHIEGVTESAVVHHNPEQRWVYFSQMKRDDVVLFKAYDSETNVLVPHTAFVDPSTPADVAARTSFELRAYVCWYE